jgi:hypothetical protein
MLSWVSGGRTLAENDTDAPDRPETDACIVFEPGAPTVQLIDA